MSLNILENILKFQEKIRKNPEANQSGSRFEPGAGGSEPRFEPAARIGEKQKTQTQTQGGKMKFTWNLFSGVWVWVFCFSLGQTYIEQKTKGRALRARPFVFCCIYF